jgi:hypothetical protein
VRADRPDPKPGTNRSHPAIVRRVMLWVRSCRDESIAAYAFQVIRS